MANTLAAAIKRSEEARKRIEVLRAKIVKRSEEARKRIEKKKEAMRKKGFSEEVIAKEFD